MTKIFLIRHGEAEGNTYRRAQGQRDTPLTPRGREQLRYVTKRFENIHIDAAYSSDYSRAYETALAAVDGHGIPVTKDERLREVCLGIWEDCAWGNVWHDTPEELWKFCFDPESWYVDGAERVHEVQRRMKSALLDIARTHEDETVLVASHGTAIRHLLLGLLGIPSGEIARIPHPGNTAVAVLLSDGESITVESYNDCSHLPENLTSFGKGTWFDHNCGEKSRNLRFEPLRFPEEEGRYLDCYRDAWRCAHGSLDGFEEQGCLQSAHLYAARSPYAAQMAWRRDEFAGVLVLDECRGAQSGIGWIAFLYISPDLRRQRGGTQLIGAAVSRYRALDRRVLRLSVAPENPAVAFYQSLDFKVVDVCDGALSRLYIMEKTL